MADRTTVKTEKAYTRVTPKQKRDLRTVANARDITVADVLRIMGVNEASEEADRIRRVAHEEEAASTPA